MGDGATLGNETWMGDPDRSCKPTGNREHLVNLDLHP